MEPDLRQHDGVIDFLTDACQVPEEYKREDGLIEKHYISDTKRAWYKTLLVNSQTFGRCALRLEQLGNKADEAFYHMTHTRAQILYNQIIADNKAYMYSIDAKSSESVRDKNNTQGTLLHLLNRNKIEKQYTLTGQSKKTFWQGLVGKEGRDETAEE